MHCFRPLNAEFQAFMCIFAIAKCTCIHIANGKCNALVSFENHYPTCVVSSFCKVTVYQAFEPIVVTRASKWNKSSKAVISSG